LRTAERNAAERACRGQDSGARFTKCRDDRFADALGAARDERALRQ
jgi:hypothetical protein